MLKLAVNDYSEHLTTRQDMLNSYCQLWPVLFKLSSMARTKTKPVGRTPTKRRDCEAWLLRQLAASPCLARDVLLLGASAGWGWATVRRAKANVGVQSFRKGEDWWWFDPRKFDPRNEVLLQKQADLGQKQFIVPAVIEPLEAPPETPLPPAQTRPQPTAVPIPSIIAAQSLATAPQTPVVSAKSFPQQNVVPPPTEQPFAPAATLPAQAPEPRKPLTPAKPRTFHIWDSAHAGTREKLISAAGFADLYNMLLDVRFRQEQLRARGLFKEEAALNDLLACVVDALEKKKKADGLD